MERTAACARGGFGRETRMRGMGSAFTDGAAFGMGRRGYGTSAACARGGFGWETRLMGGGAAANGERRVQRLLDIFANCKRYVRHLT